MSRRAFLFAIPAVAVLARRVPDLDRRLLNRCLSRAGLAFQEFGKGTPAMLHGHEAIVAIPPCDTCGALAGLENDWREWTLSRDVHEVEPVNGHEAYDVGALHVGCPAHPAKSITYRRDTK